MSENTFFTSRGIPDPFDDDFKHGSGLPSPKSDFGHTFDHLFEAYLVSILAALTGTLRELLFPSRTGFSTGKIFGKAVAAFVACFTVRRIFHHSIFKRQEKHEAVIEKLEEAAPETGAERLADL